MNFENIYLLIYIYIYIGKGKEHFQLLFSLIGLHIKFCLGALYVKIWNYAGSSL